MKYYKVLGKGQVCCNGGEGKWIPGKWMPKIKGKLVLCENGYHLCRRKDVVSWLDKEVWLAEGRGDKVVGDGKVVFREARIVKQLSWDDRVARLFACDCAEHVLHFFEESNPGDNRPRNCINVSRRFANGDATRKELAAAWAAARDAAWDAARDAARDDAWAAARDAAWAAAWDAARAAARDAAWDAARDAARDAAWDAARDAEKKMADKTIV